MKVNIGPYLTWWGPYQIADLLQHLGVSEDRCFCIGQWLSETWIATACQWIYNKRTRQTNIHIDKWDTWSADHTLALITLPMLKQLQATQHGSGLTDNEDAPAHLWSPVPLDLAGEDPNIHQRWQFILGEMIWAFEQLVDGDWDQVYHTPTGFDLEGYTTHDARIANGLRLFGKYYRNLWD